MGTVLYMCTYIPKFWILFSYSDRSLEPSLWALVRSVLFLDDQEPWHLSLQKYVANILFHHCDYSWDGENHLHNIYSTILSWGIGPMLVNVWEWVSHSCHWDGLRYHQSCKSSGVEHQSNTLHIVAYHWGFQPTSGQYILSQQDVKLQLRLGTGEEVHLPNLCQIWDTTSGCRCLDCTTVQSH